MEPHVLPDIPDAVIPCLVDGGSSDWLLEVRREGQHVMVGDYELTDAAAQTLTATLRALLGEG